MTSSASRRAFAAMLVFSSLGWSQGRPESASTVFREDFSSAAQRDVSRSTADWGQTYAGALIPGAGGGVAVHGDLRVLSGVRVIDVSNFWFPPSQTLTGGPVGPVAGASVATVTTRFARRR